MSDTARFSACPACDVAPLAQNLAGRAGDASAQGQLVLSLPTIHCAICITAVERALTEVAGVRSARVNLTLKRVTVDAPGLLAQDLVPVLERAGYEAHELDAAMLERGATDRVGRDLLMRIGVAGFAMMNIMILSVAVWSGADAASRDLFHGISALIALPTIAFAGQPFFSRAMAAVKARRLGMDVPISLALILATGISLYETQNSGRHAYFDAAVMLCFFLLIGRYLDHRTRAIARSAAAELSALEVQRALRIANGTEDLVPVASLRPGDLVRVLPGARVPADGEVADGTSEVDRSLLTGETLPVVAATGDLLSAGEINLTGPLTLRVRAAGRDSSLSQLTALVEAAESARGRYTSLAERASRAYAPVVHILAFTSFLGWFWISRDLRHSVNIAAAVLIITCPCALGLAVPAVVTAASGRLFRKGLLIKNGTALERLAQVDTVVFDKTGTLTMGKPRLISAQNVPAGDAAVALALAAGSSHPLSRALVDGVDGLSPAEVEEIREHPGYGVAGIWKGRQVRLGRASWLGQSDEHADRPGLSSWLSIEGQAPIRLDFEDALRPGASECIAQLHRDGLQVVLLSGDREASVADLAAQLGIREYRSSVDPIGKASTIEDLARQGRRVLMVGDGLNDTAALAKAHVSISPASALDAARVASDMVLTGHDLAPVADAIRTAQLATRRIKENFTISAVYNIIAVPFAVAGLATPLIAALAMSASSVSVTLNALRLRQTRS